MINPKEIRIGNWFKRIDEERDSEFEQWDERTWYAIGECILFYEYYEPIPITEEWLVKFGFILIELTVNGTGRTPYFLNENFIIEVYHGESGFVSPKNYNFYYDSGKYIVGLYSIHQLQNLYFALTGEELTINKLK